MIHSNHFGVEKVVQEETRNRPIELVAVINSFNRKGLLERAIGSLTQALRKAQDLQVVRNLRTYICEEPALVAVFIVGRTSPINGVAIQGASLTSRPRMRACCPAAPPT